MIEEGTVIGPYLVQDRIGQGASAIVHRGWHDDLQRTVAMKFLPLLHQPLAKARFVREARALRRLDHPNIVEVLDTGEYEGTPFMVFDFIPAGSLADQMALQPLTSAEAMAILNGIAKGLDHAHKHGIIHRDVKPANVLLNTSGAPVIADFGLARLLEQPSATATGMFAGTPAYMSPEQAEGGEVGPRADQYSLAALAYELLAGQVPFPGDTVSEVLTALLTREPVPPSKIRPGLSAGVDKAILRGLSKKPENRWPTCQAMVDAILNAMVVSTTPRAIMAASPYIASNGTDPRIAALNIGPSEPYLTIVMPYSQAQPRKKVRRRLLAAVAAALLLGTLAVGAAWSGTSLADLTGSHPAAASGAGATTR
jgi:eukaryotic-like serine/threonine-protein kinase